MLYKTTPLSLYTRRLISSVLIVVALQLFCLQIFPFSFVDEFLRNGNTAQNNTIIYYITP